MQQATTRPTSKTRAYTSSLTRAAYKPSVRHLGRGLYRVQSASNQNTHYIVDLVDHTCTCPNGQAGKGQCWHLKKAMEIDICRQREAGRAEFRELAEAFAGLPVPPFDFKAQKVEAAPATVIHCGAGLQEAFGA